VTTEARWPELPDLTAADRNVLGLIWMLQGHGRPPTERELRDLHGRCKAAAARRRTGRRRKKKTSASWARLILTVYHNAATRRDVMARLRRLQAAPGELLGEFLDRRYDSLVSPWRGQSGRGASAAIRGEKSKRRAARALELHAAGFSDKAIAQRLHVAVKTVQRALKGQRKRARTHKKI
jgi:hypothetical protein